MSDFERINSPRVEKMAKMLEVIQTSAKSNRVSDEELAALLAPLVEALGGAPATAPSAPAPVQQATQRATTWLDMKTAIDAMPATEICDVTHYAALQLQNKLIGEGHQ